MGTGSRPLLLLTSIALAAACTSGSSGGSESEVVVGIQAEETVGSVGRVHVHVDVDGVVNTDADVAQFPKEIDLKSVTGAGTVNVKIDGYPPPGLQGVDPNAPILTRLAYAPFVRGQKKLLRIRLEGKCVQSVIAGLGGPVCTAPQTCIAGRCADAHLLPDDLEPYVANWATDAPDICRPANHGPPEVITGTGQTDYAPITDGQTLQAELGPQKGHHLWIAVRQRNLKQSGSTTTITGVQPDTGAAIPPTAFVFTFDRDEGGYCKLYGLRYQLDNGGIDYKQFLGKPLDVTVEVRDTTGATAKNTAHIMVAPTVIGE